MLKVENLCHVFSNGKTGIDDITFSIEDGEFVVITGKNGSGKTVLVKHFNGLLFPTNGEVFIDGKPVRKNLMWSRQKIGMVFQSADSQIIGETVTEDIAFGPRNLRLANDEIECRVESALRETDLLVLRNARPHTLSGGEKRKLAIASVLAMKPSLIVLDEPFSNLDYPGVRIVLELIVKLNKQGTTIVVVTHELEKLLAHSGRLIVIDRGCLVENGRPADVIDRVERYGVRLPRLGERGIDELTWLR
jgi:biotin transport system ATP-binding protein